MNMKTKLGILAITVSTLLTACGGGSSTGSGSTTNSGTGTGTGNNIIYPAFAPPFPKVVSINSPAQTITNPIIIPVFFPGTVDQSITVSYLQKVISNPSWIDLNQYGVGVATIGAPVVLTQNPPANMTTSQINTFVASNAASWAPLRGSEVFILYFPTSTTITDNPGAGYHTMTSVTLPVAYAVIPYVSLQQDAYLQYHELIEAVTDPYMKGYYYLDRDFTSINALQVGTEIGDMCLFTDFFYSNDVNQYTRSFWSNSNIAAGKPPCAMPTNSVQMFGAVPTMSIQVKDPFPIPNPSATNTTGAIQIAPGKSVTIPVKLFSYSALPAPMALTVSQTNINATKSNVASFSFDKTTGINGDTVNLTITAPTSPLVPTGSNITFAVFSTFTNNSVVQHGYPFSGMIVN